MKDFSVKRLASEYATVLYTGTIEGCRGRSSDDLGSEGSEDADLLVTHLLRHHYHTPVERDQCDYILLYIIIRT